MLAATLQRASALFLAAAFYSFPLLLAFQPGEEPRVELRAEPERRAVFLTLPAAAGAEDGPEEGPPSRAEEPREEPREERVPREEAGGAPRKETSGPATRPARVAGKAGRAVVGKPLSGKLARLRAARRGEGGRARRRHCEEGVEGIEQVADHSYTVARELVRRYTRSLKAAMELASVSWHWDHGRVDGFRLHRVRCGSPLWQAGLRSGDVVRSIDGRTVDSTFDAFRMLLRLRRAREVEVQVLRRGRPLTFHYRVEV